MKNAVHKILYIEDDPASRLLVKKIIDHPPFQYFDAPTGMEGLTSCIKIRPDLILMDIILPDISGTELATKIKSIPEFRNIIIVALTGQKSEESREISLIAGCDGYITKPINSITFADQILKFLEGQREEVKEDRREFARQRYEEKLVDHLTSKVDELQTANNLLVERTGLLKNYSLKLEKLLGVINRLQVCQTLRQLEETLLNEIKTNMDFNRCVFFEPDLEKNQLKPSMACGIEKNELANMELPIDPHSLVTAFEKKHILTFDEKSDTGKQPFTNLRKTLNSGHFILGLLGNPQKNDSDALTKQKLDELITKTFTDLHEYHDTDIEIIRDHLKEFLVSDMFTIGGYLFVDRRTSTDLSDNGKRMTPTYDIGILEMLLQAASLIYQNLQLREKLKTLFIRAEKDAVTDYLTNLFNYRYFKQQLSREFDRARRHKSRFVALMIDIDHFKLYNDTFGHQAGDAVLRNLAAVLKKNTRSSDVVARYGGEEFVIVCPELEKEMGVALGEKLRTMVAQSSITAGKDLPDKKITISVGIAAYPEDGDSPDDLINNADSALYKAKENGRNQVRVYTNDR
jgi:diguanylate cyclase (GGDEF)-like protein